MDDLIEELFFIITSHPVGQHLAGLEIVPLDERENVTIENLLAEIHGGGDVEISTIEAKMRQKSYSHNIYMFYRDLKLATSSELIKLPIGCEPYVALDEFFRYMVALVSREAKRLGLIPDEDIIITKTATGEETGEYDDIDVGRKIKDRMLDQKLYDGFSRMVTEIKEWYGESFYFIGPNGPVFSSHNGRSPIDPRDAEVHGAVSTTKLVPNLKGVEPNQMAYVSQMILRVPHPSLAPTEMLHDYVEPKSVALPSSKWLKYDAYSGFAPSVDDAGAVVGSQASGAVWFEKIGASKLEMMDDDEVDDEERAREASTAVDSAEATDKPSSVDTHDNSKDNNVGQEPVVKSQENPPQLADDSQELDIQSILEWKPGNFIDDDEMEAAKTQTESQLLSRLLLELQVLQRERFSIHSPQADFAPSEKERRVALKVQNILGRLTQQVSPQDLGIQLSPYMPVSMTNYAGVLPAPDAKQIQQQQSRANAAAAMQKSQLQRTQWSRRR